MSFRVVVLGGRGNFGARICRALAGEMEVLAAGRSAEARLDMNAPEFAEGLARLRPNLVIHCAGPFQGQDYHVARAALAAGAHYVDLADGREFVAGFAAQIEASARAAGRLAISGASTLPALSSAVVDAFLPRFERLDSIRTWIAPPARAVRGAATIGAVLGYLGRPFPWLQDGAWRNGYGWLELERVHIDGLRPRWSAACDVPDLALLPYRYPGLRTLEFRAALELGVEHLFLAAAAQLRRLGVPMRPERWGGGLDRLAGMLTRFGSDRSGMLIRLDGAGPAGPLSLQWSLLARQGHGPQIPAMPAILLARKLAAGTLRHTGAMPCMGLLTLREFETEWAQWDIAASTSPA